MQIDFSRSPYPIFGLTASAGSPVRSDPIEVRSDKIARLRMDLELVYNSVAGRSTDDLVDSHGSLHGTVSEDIKAGGGVRNIVSVVEQILHTAAVACNDGNIYR